MFLYENKKFWREVFFTASFTVKIPAEGGTLINFIT